MNKKILLTIFCVVFLIGFVSPADFGYNTIKNKNKLWGDVEINGGWEAGGCSFIEGDIYCQKGYFYNFTSLNVTQQNLTVLDNLIVNANITASNFFGNWNGSSNYVPYTGATSNLDLGSYNLTASNFFGTFIGNSSIWSRAGTNIFPTNIGDKLGVGLRQKPDTIPLRTLDIAGSINIVSVDQPLASFDLTATTGGGLTSSSTYGYSVVYVTAEGDTKGAYSGVAYWKAIDLGVGENAVQITNIPISDDSRVIKRKIYRSTADGSATAGQLLTTINNNVDTSYLDLKSDAQLDVTDSAWYKEDTSVRGFFFNNQQAMYVGWNTVSVGTLALNDLKTGYGNTAVGADSGKSLVSGSSNSLFGYRAGQLLTTGKENSYFGMYSGYNNVGGTQNVGVGYLAGRASSSSSTTGNTALGYGSLYQITTGSDSNTAIGYRSGQGFRGSRNIFIGADAGYLSVKTIGNYNILIGDNAGDNADTGADGNILIGKWLDLQIADGDDQLSIGNLIFATGGFGTGTTVGTGNVGIGTTTPQNTLNIIGTLNVTNATGTLGLYQDAEGQVGIGTGSPDVKVEIDVGTGAGSIVDGVTNAGIKITDSNNGIGARKGIAFASNTAGLNGILGGIEVDVLSGWDTHMDFYNRQGGTLTNVLHLDESGYVGINTTTPQNLLNVLGDGNFTGNLYGSLIYGEAWYHNHTATELDFAVDGLYYNLTFSDSLVNGMTFNDTGDYLEVDIGGVYKVSYIGSGDGQNNHAYFTSVTINGVVQERCESHKKMSAGADVVTMAGSCLLSLSVDDKVRLATADIGGTGTGNYYSSNLNLVRIGN